MDRKVLKDKIDELRSTAKMELACTIREIMRERGILSKELKNPVKCSDGLFEAVLIETNGKDTAIPTITHPDYHATYDELQKSGEESIPYGF